MPSNRASRDRRKRPLIYLRLLSGGEVLPGFSLAVEVLFGES